MTSKPLHDVERLFTELCGVPQEELAGHLYLYTEAEAVRHALRVASGLDSMLLGETQVLGQFKHAAATAQSLEQPSRAFSSLIESVFRSARQIRSKCGLGEHALSLGMAAEKLIGQIFSQPESLGVLAVGAGQTNRQVLRHLLKTPFTRLDVLNRSAERAAELCTELEAVQPHVLMNTGGLDQLETRLCSSDVVVSCTASLRPLIEKPMLAKAMKQRRYKPMLIVDLAVPRDVEPSCAQLDEVYLYGIDDLESVIEENRRLRMSAAANASLEVERQCARINSERKVAALAHDFEALQQVLEQKISQTEQEGLEGKQALSRLGVRLMHGPYKLVREIAQIEDQALQRRLIQVLLSAYSETESDSSNTNDD